MDTKQQSSNLKDGYYVSAYLDISKLGNIYKIGTRHDKCVALWKKSDKEITLLHYWEMERLTGLKEERIALFDEQECTELLNSLIGQYGITLDDINEIWGIPEFNKEGNYLSTPRYPDASYHTMCHLATTLFMDTNVYKNEDILAFSVDGGSDNIMDYYIRLNPGVKSERKRNQFIGCFSKKGEWDSFTIFQVNSPGLLWTVASVSLEEKEGTLMALASASKSETFIEFEYIYAEMDEKQASAYDVSDPLIGSMFEDVDEISLYINTIDRKFNKIKDNIMALSKEDEGIKFNYFDERFSEKENKYSMIMKVIMKMTYESMEQNVDYAIRHFGIDPKNTYLGMAGGFSLSCPTNTYLINKYGFKNFVAPPCPGDSGMALGIGLYAFYDKMNGDFNFDLKNAFHGDSDDVNKYLINEQWLPFIAESSDFDVERAINDLEDGVVVWFEGKSEMGPRALGARSILGDPRKSETKDRLNEVKQRQWWRPVAPIIKREFIKEWMQEQDESPYMLHASHVKESKKQYVPAILHEDGTARLQSIDPDTSQKWLYEVLDAFHKKTGIPIICNTSLNDRSEPIINFIDQAFNFALRKGIKVGYFNGKRVQFKNHANFFESVPQRRNVRIPVWNTNEEREKLIEQYNPHNYPARLINLFVYCNLGKGYEFFELDKERQKKYIEFIKYFLQSTPYYNKALITHITKMAKTD